MTAPVDVGNKWSDWMTTVPIGDDIITESRDEYRYKDSKIIKSATQPTTESYNLISKNSARHILPMGKLEWMEVIHLFQAIF